ncbi:ferrichrome porin FhuA [Dickeya dadantii]|uniref:ferrichrome porin FhuA n=1 Tax=Dickeya dadantii TaxID=204038 RepID=UPI001CF38DE1|nr:ferrichrome porin FhuA [Dickeya dadantii]MCA7013177.1 ferrichrome porin FhuA [Dickeya dadantii]
MITIQGAGFGQASPSHAQKRALALLISAALAGVTSVTAYADDTITTDIINVDASAAASPENAWSAAPTIAAKRSATGTKTDTAIEKNPQSVSVVTSEEMQTRQVVSVKDALNYTPGVFAGNRGSSNTYDVVNLRGFTAVNTNQYLDGLKLQGDNYSEAALDPYMLERVEVLRGPVSVLYGKSSPGGLVALVSKRPTAETIREVQFKMGTDNLFQTGFDFGGAIDDQGVYTYRLTGVAKSSDTQQDLAKEKRYAIAPSFSWQPDSNTRFTLLTNFQNDPYAGFYGWLPRQGTVNPFLDGNGNQHKLSTSFNDGEASNKMARNQKMVGYSAEHAFNDTWTVRQNLRYMQLETQYRGIYGSGISASLPYVMDRASVISHERLNSFTVDNQAQATFSTADVSHTMLFGVDYMRMRNDIDEYFGSASSLNLLNPAYGDDSIPADSLSPWNFLNRQEQTGVYVQDQAQWNQWLVTLGGRYDRAKTSAQNRTSGTTDANSQGQFTWRGGVNYLFDNGITPYFSYSESFEPTSGASASGQTFKPSLGKQYEAGVKYVPKDRPLVLTAAVYSLTKSNNLTTDPDNTNFSVQSGEITVRGLELEAKSALTQNINVTAAYSHVNAKYTHDTDLQGKRPYQIPNNQASLWADYTFNRSVLSGLTVGSGVRYVGSSYGDANNTFKVAPYGLLDAMVKYDLAAFGMPGSSLAVNVDNLLNRQYVASCYTDYACYWGSERRVTATATFRF